MNVRFYPYNYIYDFYHQYYVQNLKLKIQNYFVNQFHIRYLQPVDEFCDGLKCNTPSIVILGDFLVA